MRIPIVVFELLLGILVGPSLLGWAVPSDFVGALSEFGLAMLFFVAGSEIEFAAFRGRTGRFAVGGWLISLAAGVGLTWILFPGEVAIVVGIALCSTALGTILPILRDAAELRTPFGQAIGAIGAVGEFGPLIAISLFLGGRSPGIETIVLAIFGLIAGLAIWPHSGCREVRCTARSTCHCTRPASSRSASSSCSCRDWSRSASCSISICSWAPSRPESCGG